MDKDTLVDLYLNKRYSVTLMSQRLSCSQSKIDYWLKKHGIQKRSISEAVYSQRNPKGDPFVAIRPVPKDKTFLYGLGLGLYWGEGTKSDLYSVRLGNTDPDLIRMFIKFLKEIYLINPSKLKFGLQLFNDSSIHESLDFWSKRLDISREQFQKPIISDVRGPGSYRIKSKYGVLTLYFNNKKLRDIVGGSIEKLRDA